MSSRLSSSSPYPPALSADLNKVAASISFDVQNGEARCPVAAADLRILAQTFSSSHPPAATSCYPADPIPQHASVDDKWG